MRDKALLHQISLLYLVVSVPLIFFTLLVFDELEYQEYLEISLTPINTLVEIDRLNSLPRTENFGIVIPDPEMELWQERAPQIKALMEHALATAQILGIEKQNYRPIYVGIAHDANYAGLTDALTRSIALSDIIFDFNARAQEETLIHELSHVFAGPGESHGARWQEICNTLLVEIQRKPESQCLTFFNISFFRKDIGDYLEGIIIGIIILLMIPALHFELKYS